MKVATEGEKAVKDDRTDGTVPANYNKCMVAGPCTAILKDNGLRDQKRCITVGINILGKILNVESIYI